MPPSAYKVIYLTGAPATGKSTLSERVAEVLPNVHLFSYSKELSAAISRKAGETFTQEDMRRHSARLITPLAVEEVDRQLFSFVEKNRNTHHIIIDSHAVTKESWGFRVTPFSAETLRQLSPDLIVSLYTNSETAISRIKGNPMGRPTPSEFEANSHTFFQASVAISYSIHLGTPAYFLDSEKSLDLLVEWFSQRLS